MLNWFTLWSLHCLDLWHELLFGLMRSAIKNLFDHRDTSALFQWIQMLVLLRYLIILICNKHTLRTVEVALEGLTLWSYTIPFVRLTIVVSFTLYLWLHVNCHWPCISLSNKKFHFILCIIYKSLFTLDAVITLKISLNIRDVVGIIFLRRNFVEWYPWLDCS